MLKNTPSPESWPKGFLLILLCSTCLFVIAAEVEESASPRWQAFDELPELEQQTSHNNPRMRYRLLNSRVLDKNTLWQPFSAELADFSEQDYTALKPLILEADIARLQQAVLDGVLSYEQLTTFYLYRIRKIESDNSRSLNALIATNPAAIEQARALDQRRREGTLQIKLDSLIGMPVLLKDNIGATGMATTAGAVALQYNEVDDAFVTARIRASGGIILGKANLSEWAYFFCQGCPLGYSAMGGQTFNPYGRKVIESGGSSSGSAVAVAANLAVVAVGSETSGSILSPSSLNSVVGLKPTTGLISRTGVVPISSTLDTTGPIARTVQDAVILLNAMTGYDAADTSMPAISGSVRFTYSLDSLQGTRLGVLSDFQNSFYDAAVLALTDVGAEAVAIELLQPALEGFSDFLGAEMKISLAQYLAAHAATEVTIETVADLQVFNLNDIAVRAPYGQDLVDSMAASNYSADEVLALKKRLQSAARSTLDALFVENQLDVLLSINNFHAAIAALANYPALTLPMAYDVNGQPLGLTLISSSYGEQDLIRVAAKYEQLTKVRQLPDEYR